MMISVLTGKTRRLFYLIETKVCT